MTTSNKKLSFSGNAILLDKISTNYTKFVDGGASEIPNKQIYKIACEDESPRIIRSARKAALAVVQEKNINSSSIKKVAFDSRRIDQETERNPRSNLQYWNRSDAFVDEGDQYNIKVLAKLFKSLESIKEKYGRQPEYLDSYSRQMHEQVARALRVNAGDHDYYRPQFAYIEQILFARYRLTFDELLKWSDESIQFKFLQKDENLLKRGYYLNATNESDPKFGNDKDDKIKRRKTSAIPAVERISDSSEIEQELIKQNNFANDVVKEVSPFLSAREVSTVNSAIDSSNGIVNGITTQDSIINALFGRDVVRRPGEKASSRTITITIKDAEVEPD